MTIAASCVVTSLLIDDVTYDLEVYKPRRRARMPVVATAGCARAAITTWVATSCGVPAAGVS